MRKVAEESNHGERHVKGAGVAVALVARPDVQPVDRCLPRLHHPHDVVQPSRREVGGEVVRLVNIVRIVHMQPPTEALPRAVAGHSPARSHPRREPDPLLDGISQGDARVLEGTAHKRVRRRVVPMRQDRDTEKVVDLRVGGGAIFGSGRL